MKKTSQLYQPAAPSTPTLRVVLKGKWFEMENQTDPELRKDEEYRDVTPYWIRRLLMDIEVKDPSISYEQLADLIKSGSKDASYSFQDFEVYEARHGYQSDAPVLRRRCLGITVGPARPEWSDNWQGNVFIIKLGDNLR